MAYDWKELAGSRQIDDDNPRVIDYHISFTGSSTSTVPTNGTAIGTITGSGSISPTGLASEPVAVRVRRRRATTNAYHLDVVFRGFYVV